MTQSNELAIYEFDAFRVDTATRQLYSDGVPVPLTSKAFETLAVLIKNRGETVSKAELMNKVWGDTAVEENNLTQQISAIRRAFGERARDHRFIVTVPGRGYCFVALVREAPFEVSEYAKRPPVARPLDPGSFLGIGLAVAYVFLVCIPVIILAAGQVAEPQTVAILAFRTVGDQMDEPLGIGIRDTLRAKLGNLDDVTVRPSRSDTERDAIVAGRRLSADIVLTGSIQHDNERVRVAVEIVNVRYQRIVWGKTFDESTANLFDLQDSIASEVIQALRRPRSLSKNFDLFNEGRPDVGSVNFAFAL
jgi:DNA-binding winged helix-turn-helix (wHTH) protein/TolB-like protein